MVTVESMLNATKEAPSIWLEYVNKKQCLKDNAYVFCFFEGEDRKYYNDRVEEHLTDIQILGYVCGNRDEVIKVYKKILSEKDDMSHLLFFVDRDYNFESYEANDYVYQTPEYSIENFYCKKSAVKKIMEIEFGIQPDSKDMTDILSLFEKSLEDFFKYYSCINIWYMSCKKKNISVKITKFNPKRDIEFSEFTLVLKNNAITQKNIAEYYKELLEKDVAQRKKHAENNLAEYLTKLDLIKDEIEVSSIEYNCSKNFRGKFALEFLKIFIGYIKKINNEENLEKKYLHIHIDEHAKNILSNLSKYAITPPCLIQYISNHKPLVSKKLD